ncbi:unnamed protein product, partial [Rotaria magnacalcarata]
TPTVPFVEKRPRSLSPHVYDSPPGHRLSYPIENECHQRSDDNIVPQLSHLASSMTIDQSTR